jgi:hypothetical protein
VSAGASLVYVWDVTSGTQLWGFNIPNQCLSLEFADQDRLLLGALGNSCVTIWDVATGIVREIAGWTEDLSLFSHGRVISLHFDNASDTLISLDDSNGVMIHHCTDFAGNSEELKPSFDQEFSEAIRQVLSNTGHTRLFVSSSLKDTLWAISSTDSLITKTIEWENRERYRWASHPSQRDKLVLLIGSVLHLYE